MRFEEPHALLAGRAAVVVLAAGVLMADVGIGDDEAEVRRDRHGPRRQRAAVDDKGCAGDAAGGDVLVHDAAAHADEVVLGALADPGGRDGVEGQARRREERMGDADFERRRGAQARSERHVAPDDEVRAGEPPAALFDHRRDAEHVVRPVVAAARRGPVEVELARFVHEQGIDADLAVRREARRRRGWRNRAPPA